MSGTSLDGIDAVLADFGAGPQVCTLVAATHVDFPAELRRELFALQSSGPDEIVRAARAANRLADLYAHAADHYTLRDWGADLVQEALRVAGKLPSKFRTPA